MEDCREKARPPRLRLATEADIGKAPLYYFMPDGIIHGGREPLTQRLWDHAKINSMRYMVLADPPDLQALAHEIRFIMSNDPQKDIAEIIELLERTL